MLDEIELVKKSVKGQEHYADFNPQSQKVDLHELLQDCLAPFVEDAKKKKIDISAVESIELELPRSQMHLVFSHLIKNGLEALKACPNPCLTISTKKTEGSTLVSFQDNGVGFDETAKSHLFEYGFSTKDSGQGIGLHFVANSLHRIGASIQAHSDGPGQGSLFVVNLPNNLAKV